MFQRGNPLHKPTTDGTFLDLTGRIYFLDMFHSAGDKLQRMFYWRSVLGGGYFVNRFLSAGFAAGAFARSLSVS